MLVLLPPGERRLEFAEPMGTPAVLSSRIAELLPGTTFDADRRGTFRRGGRAARGGGRLARVAVEPRRALRPQRAGSPDRDRRRSAAVPACACVAEGRRR